MFNVNSTAVAVDEVKTDAPWLYYGVRWTKESIKPLSKIEDFSTKCPKGNRKIMRRSSYLPEDLNE